MDGFNRRPFLSVPLDFRDEGTVGTTVWYPSDVHMTPELQRTVVDVVTQKLGLSDTTATWHTTGTQPHVVIRPRRKPPGSATWNDYLDAILAAKETEPVIGVTAGGKLITANLEDDSPHILISAGSGGGKSSLTRLICCQALRRGGQLVVLDYKRTSHNWAKGLPGVTYAKRINEIHDALLTLAGIAEDRNERAEDPNEDLGPRIWLLAEEMNATADKLRDYWDQIREKDEPKRSPAIQALKDLLFMGRSALVHVIAVAQRLDASVVGGGAARENFADRYLCRYTPQSWRMLAGDVWPMPKRSGLVGRWQSIKHGEANETQVIFVDDETARTYANGGVPAIENIPYQRKASERVLARTCGLRDAVAILPGSEMTLDALRKHSQRDALFPAPVRHDGTQNVYDLDELVAWKTRRDAAALVGGMS
jgi:hypothetical protein